MSATSCFFKPELIIDETAQVFQIRWSRPKDMKITINGVEEKVQNIRVRAVAECENKEQMGSINTNGTVIDLPLSQLRFVIKFLLTAYVYAKERKLITTIETRMCLTSS